MTLRSQAVDRNFQPARTALVKNTARALYLQGNDDDDDDDSGQNRVDEKG